MGREVVCDDIIETYAGMFKNELDEMALCTISEHKIVTNSAIPVMQRNIQIPKLWENEIDQEIDRLLASGIIAHSKSAWASRIIPVRKKSEEIRMCIDYRKLNERTEKDLNPLPKIDELIDELAKARVFSILDA